MFAPLFHAGFVNLDDGAYVAGNPHVHEGFTRRALVWAWTSAYAANWHPLTWMSHMLDWRLFGKHAGGHHAVNVLLHAANALLLMLLFARLTRAPIPSALVAALFALHPQHVESVAWVAERKDVLSTTFWLLSTLAYVRYARRPAPALMVPVALLLALGLCAKPMLVTLPFTLLLLDAWPLGRLSLERWSWTALRPLVLEKIPLFVLVAASSVVTYLAQRSGQATGVLGLGLAVRAENAAVSYATYLIKTIWPTRLAIFYPHPGADLSWLAVAGSLLLLVGATAVAWRVRRKQPAALVGWLWYLGTLVPVIGLVQVGGQARADRYTYVPLIGVFAALVWAAEQWGRVARWAIVAALAVLALVAHTQARTWVDSIAVWSHALEAAGPQAEFQASLGDALVEAGRRDEAERHYAEALRRDPADADANNGMGLLLLERGQAAAAVPRFERALATRPSYAGAHNNLARALAGVGPPEPALAHALAAVRLDPDLAQARINAGALLSATGRQGEAEAQLREACRLDPESADAWSDLGAVLLAAGRPAEAAAALDQALRLHPQDAKPRDSLGRALGRLGRTSEALGQFQEAVRLEPDYAEARNDLGQLLVDAGRVDEGIAQYEAALRGRPDYVEALNNLGCALILAGRLSEAADRLGRALALRPDYAHAHANLASAYHLAGRDAEAWAEVALARRYGLEPPAELIAALAARGLR